MSAPPLLMHSHGGPWERENNTVCIFCYCAFGCPRYNRSTYRGGTHDDVRVDTVSFKML